MSLDELLAEPLTLEHPIDLLRVTKQVLIDVAASLDLGDIYYQLIHFQIYAILQYLEILEHAQIARMEGNPDF